ncbi:hypothetical protein VE04_10032, partial [Pseudogymnoascus sp. 24MN13]
MALIEVIQYNAKPSLDSHALRTTINDTIQNAAIALKGPDDIFHVVLSRPAFGSDGPVAAPVVEFVQSYFPASRVTPEFQRGIEEDFARFDKIYKKGVKGDLGLSSGWVLDEQEHENIEDEKAKCFIIARGWESMDCFEQSVQNDA